MRYDKEDYPPFKFYTMCNMRLVWGLIRDGDGLTAVQVQDLVNHLEYDRMRPGEQATAKEMKKRLKGGDWKLSTIHKCLWSLRALGLIKQVARDDHIKKWVVTPDSRVLEFPDPDVCWDEYHEAPDDMPY
jgi:hypothetical protein